MDRLPPVVHALAFDPPSISDGAATTLLLRITDDDAGVKKVSGKISSPSGSGLLEFVAQGQEGGNEFIARLTIPPQAETGAWFVSRLTIVDRADNWLDTLFSSATVPAGGTLMVSSSDSDSTPPDVRNVWVEKGTVYDGESNTITVQIEDDRSEVAWVLGSFKSRSTGALIPFECSASPVPGTWEGAFQMPASADCGEWSLFVLRFADTAGNVGEMRDGSRKLPRVVFVVVSNQCDSSPPTLESLSVSPTVVSSESATEVQIAATVRDEGSGMDSVSGHLRGPDGPNGQFAQIFFTCARSGTDPEAPWTAKITMPQSAARGTWRFGLLRLKDKAKNMTDFWLGNPATAGVTLEVQ